MLRSAGLGAARRMRRSGQEVNPLDGITNLADIMLVFACGLMLALILNWNVDLNHKVVILPKENMVETNALDDQVQNGMSNSDFAERGVVYQDEKTGKMYIVMP